MRQKSIFSFLIFTLRIRFPHTKLVRSTYNFKNCTTEMNYNYFYFYLQTLKMGANGTSGKGLQYAIENMHQHKILRKL